MVRAHFHEFHVFTTCSQGFHQVFTTCSPGFHKVFTRFSQGFHKVFTRFSQGFHKVFTRFPQGFHKVFTRCSRGFHKVFTTFAPGFRNMFMIFGRTDHRKGVSPANFDAESDFEVRLAVAPHKPSQNCKKLILYLKISSTFFWRRKMKCWRLCKTRFGKV